MNKILFIMAQIFGTIAMIFWVMSIQLKNKKSILKMQIFANIFYGIQYTLLNSFSTACMNVVSTIRMLLINKKEKKGKEVTILFPIVISLIIILIGFVTYTGYLSLFPIIITLVYTFATWQKNTRIIRITFLICGICWFYFNFRINAYVSLIGNCFEVISGIVSIIRFDILKKGEEIK